MIADTLRRSGKSILLAVNKTEGLDPSISVTDAYELGIGTPAAIAAVHGSGIVKLIEPLFSLNLSIPNQRTLECYGIKLAIVGRPNVGKSTLNNRMLGEERVIVHDLPAQPAIVFIFRLNDLTNITP